MKKPKKEKEKKADKKIIKSPLEEKICEYAKETKISETLIQYDCQLEKTHVCYNPHITNCPYRYYYLGNQKDEILPNKSD